MRILGGLLLLLATTPSLAEDIGGEAHYAGTNRPAAGVTLRLDQQGEMGPAIVTDAQGRFRLPVPVGTDPRLNINNGGPQVYVEAEVPGRWTREFLSEGSLGPPSENQRKTVDQALARPAKSVWTARGQDVYLRVECPTAGEVDVLVRGPDGQPLPDRDIRVTPSWLPIEGTGFDSPVRFAGRTDASGRFRMRWITGPRQLKIQVGDEFLGATPPFSITADTTTQVETTPLVRLGTISGQLDPSLVGPGTVVRSSPVHDMGFSRSDTPPVACDDQGRFTIRGFTPGQHRLRVSRRQESIPVLDSLVWVAPGGTVNGVTLTPPPPPRAGDPDPNTAMNGPNLPAGPDGQPLNMTLIEGTIRDRSGKGVGGASVYARVTYDGGMRAYQEVHAATTDEQGRYQVRGPMRQFMSPFTVIAAVKGRPLAAANVPTGIITDKQAANLDLTLADQGGSARVSVLRDGRPVSGASVTLIPHDRKSILSESGYPFRAQGSNRPALDAFFIPFVTTDAQGLANFTNLVPGVYTASARIASNLPPPPWPEGPRIDSGQSLGLVVVAGREARATLNVFDGNPRATLQVLHPDSRPVSHQSLWAEVGPKGGPTQFSTSIQTDAIGVGQRSFDGPGLYRIQIRFSDDPSQPSPTQEPFFEAEAYLPLAAGLPMAGPVLMRGFLRKPGSLRVRLLDPEGKPAQGVVEVHGLVSQWATTDARGEIRFPGMAGQKYRVNAVLDGPTPPAWRQSGPWFEDAELRGRYVAVPSTEVDVESDREAVLELRGKPVGFVQGQLIPEAGRTVSQYYVNSGTNYFDLQPNQRLDRDTGRIVVGPLFAGSTTFYIMSQGSEQYEPAGTQVVEVAAGNVVHAEFRPSADPKDAKQGMGMGRNFPRTNPVAPTPISVLLSDGVTPAFAAYWAVFVPGWDQPLARGQSDGLSQSVWRGPATVSGGTQPGRPGDVTESTLVVSLPGQTGATIVPIEPGKATRVVLPPSIAAEGTVTLGGQPSGSRPVRIRVLAEAQNRGVIGQALQVEVTPQPDGRFTLAGLTPGLYQVQAVRDDLWLSPMIQLTVEPGRPLAPLALDIPEPGEPILLELTDPAGQPFADQSLTLDRPAGPLANLWPDALQTNPGGQLLLLGLSAGTHTLRHPDLAAPIVLNLRPAPQPAVPPTLRAIKIQRKTP